MGSQPRESMGSPAHGPVVVVGGGIAGMAAAARLAKSGHSVELFEADDRLGGAWAPEEIDGVLVDGAPSVLGFPAPWRDLFRKSGRPLEAELSRIGASLEPAPPVRYRFADGSELVLPTDRGDQHEVLSHTYGVPVATRWCSLIDRLDQVWQAVRPLGLEAELRESRQLSAVKRVLQPRRTLSDLAATLDEPHLAAVVASVAYRLGSHPDRTPAWCAVDLSVQRTFGRWTITAAEGSDRVGRSSVLAELLAARLALRRVVVHFGQPISALVTTGHRITGVVTADSASHGAAAVVCTVDPWQTYAVLLSGKATPRRRRAQRRWRPALAPAVTHKLLDERSVGVTETVGLASDGTPTISYTRPTDGATLRTVHDYARAAPSRSAGIGWSGFRSWLDRPTVTSEVNGLYLAGPFSPGGSSPSAVVLSGALAAYACHDYLGST